MVFSAMYTTGSLDSRAKPVVFPLRRQNLFVKNNLDIFRHVLKGKNPSRVRLKLPNKSRNGTTLQSHFAMDVSVIDEPAVRLEKQRVHDARERLSAREMANFGANYLQQGRWKTPNLQPFSHRAANLQQWN
jgi:hypothetical protein